MPPHRHFRRPAPTAAARGVAALAIIALATSVAAQIVPTGSPAADILLTRALADQRVFLTCSSLDPKTHAQALAAWQRDVTDAVAILAANATPAEAISAFEAAARPQTLLPAADTPFAEVRQLCENNPDWHTAYQQNATPLPLQLQQALK